MKFYQLHRTFEAGTSAGFEYFFNKRDADRARSNWLKEGIDKAHGAEIELIELNPTRNGILKALNRFANHPDNG